MKSLLTDMAQFMDAVKPELVAANAWSEWDQSIRDGITRRLMQFDHAERVGPLDADRLSKLRDSCWGRVVAFNPEVVKDLIAEIDRLAAENADMAQRMERARKIAAEMGEIIRGSAT